MDTRQIFGVDATGGLVLFALIAAWYWWPRVKRVGTVDALTPLLLLHVSRTVGLTILVPGVSDPGLPRSFAVPAAYGDLVAAGLALLAIAALRASLSLGEVVAWIFTVEGVVDLLNAMVQGARIDLPTYDLGATWFIFTMLVPALLVTHAMIAAILIRTSTLRRRTQRPAGSM